jgi:tetratricopeptide (TPR) repeat protein
MKSIMTRGKTRGPGPQNNAARLRAEAVALHRAGRLAEAEAAYRRFLKAVPADADAWHLAGVAVLQQGRAAEAVEVIGEAVRRDQSVPQYHDNLGSALASAGRFMEAAQSHLRALRLRPESEGACFNLGNALSAIDHPQAVSAFLLALTLSPGYAKAWFNLGNRLRRTGDARNAVVAFRRAAMSDPALPSTNANWGEALAAMGRHEEAAERHAVAVRVHPAGPDGWYNLGSALQQTGSMDRAVHAQQRALALDPAHARAHNNLGNAVRQMLRFADAERHHRHALILEPGLAEAHYNRANALAALNRNREAVAGYGDALAIDPAMDRAVFNRGRVLLAQGGLVAGWEGYERRFAAGEAQPDRRFPVPRWDGGPVAGRLLVWREQGVGDEILFSSCYGELPLAARPIVETDPRLVSLFQRSFPQLEIRPERLAAPPDGDVGAEIPAGSLPRLMRSRLSSFPVRPAWLAPDPERVAAWRARAGRLPPGLRIGISWTSGKVDPERAPAYTRLADWLPLFDVPGAVIVSLQYGDREDEIAGFEARHGVRLHRWADLDLKDDFEGVGALIANLDLVVSVGTAVSEFAAALGVPVWRLGLAGEWPNLGQTVRPWYPAIRCIRPASGGPITETLENAAAELRRIVPAGLPDFSRSEGALDRALAAHRDERAAEAEEAYRRALGHWPGNAEAGRLLAVLLHQSGRDGEALTVMADVLRASSASAEAWNDLGLIQQEAGRFDGAVAAFARAVSLLPAAAEVLTHLGVARGRLGEKESAVAWQRRAVRLDPENAKQRVNLGVAEEKGGGFDEAHRIYRIALTLDPGHAEALNNLGNAARLTGSGDEERWVRRTVRVDPGHALAGWNLGLIELAAGNLDAGWAGYERRFRAEALQRGRRLPVPEWQGEDLSGRSLLVWNEQGLGDEILFASCLSSVKGLATRTVVECDRRLVPLFARAFPWAEVRSRGPVDVDVHIAMGSLPSRARRRLSDFPGGPWLAPDPVLAGLWRERVAALPSGLRIGIAWRSGLIDPYRRPAYTTLDDWAPLLTLPGVTAVSLQYGAGEAEIGPVEERLGVRLHRWDDLDLKDDLDGVAALMSGLDLVCSVPTAAGELAGALGVPVWRLCGPDWTWLGTGVRPWYPTQRTWTPIAGVGELPRTLAAALRRITG